MQGYCVGQIRLVFKLPQERLRELLPDINPLPSHLVYIEWFSSFTRRDVNHGLYKSRISAVAATYGRISDQSRRAIGQAVT
ncbi:hypothetical protein C8Q72DRAFT_983154, partial [Fomitopsis betulina]